MPIPVMRLDLRSVVRVRLYGPVCGQRLCYDRARRKPMSWTIDRAAVFDTRGRAPRYERIATAIEGALERGDLRPGDRLPTVRALARQLEVSSASVAVAYSLLERRGRLNAYIGRGTFVRAAGLDGRPAMHLEPRANDSGNRPDAADGHVQLPP